jgi:hypothetical protein
MANSDLQLGFTSENLKILEDAIATGARKVKYTDKEVEYRSLKEMSAIRHLMRKKLGLTGKTEKSQPVFTKGL